MHPSWRDLVIEELASDATERRRFLSRCGVDGAAVALAPRGGAEGERARPLLRDDADWDALGDGLHHACADLDEAEAVRLLDVIADAGEDAETRALAELVLRRLGWSGKAVSVDAIGAWAAVSKWLDPRPTPPAVAMTWLELEPHQAPETPEEIERMADWLRLAELLTERAPRAARRPRLPGALQRHPARLRRQLTRAGAAGRAPAAHRVARTPGRPRPRGLRTGLGPLDQARVRDHEPGEPGDRQRLGLPGRPRAARPLARASRAVPACGRSRCSDRRRRGW